MQIKIRNFRGIETADISVAGGITLLAGLNASGKSSAAQAVAAAVTGNTIPFSGFRKTDAKKLVHDENTSGHVNIISDNGETSVAWPDGKRASIGIGSPPAATMIAAGLESLVDILKTAERAKMLAPYLKSQPTKDDLAYALPDIRSELVDGLWKSIELNGWDSAYDQAKQKGAETKGRWRQVTGSQYGIKKAAEWTPAGWDYATAGSSEEPLRLAVFNAGQNLETAIKNQATDEIKLAELREEAGYQVDIQELEQAIVSAQQLHKERITAREQLPPADSNKSGNHVNCPYCREKIVVTGGAGAYQFQKAALIPDEEISARYKAIAQADGKTANAKDAMWDAQHKLAEAQVKIKKAQEARVILEKENNGQKTTAAQSVDCRDMVYRAELQLKNFRDKTEADRLHNMIETNQEIVSVLVADGLRAKKLKEGVEVFNQEFLLPLCRIAKWSEVSLEDELIPGYGGRPYSLLSESEKFRVRVTLQVAMALMEKSDMVIIDGADILDQKGRGGLFSMLFTVKIPSLVCMTVAFPGKTPPPDLKKMGCGETYWVENGAVCSLNRS